MNKFTLILKYLALLMVVVVVGMGLIVGIGWLALTYPAVSLIGLGTITALGVATALAQQDPHWK